MMSSSSRAIRERLHDRRRALLAHYQTVLALADEEQQPETELVDAANEHWDLQVLSRMSDTDARALANVVDALHRLNAGRYGVCIDCEGPINQNRLAAVPETARCFACATNAEQHQQRARG